MTMSMKNFSDEIEKKLESFYTPKGSDYQYEKNKQEIERKLKELFKD